MIKSYNGNKKYIFVSYCHDDEEKVYPIIQRLQEEGYRLWYDEAVSPGDEWPEVIAEHLDGCESFIAFVSNNSMDSHNCRREFNYAVMENKKMLCLFLDKVQFTPVMKMQMSTIQAINVFENISVDDLIQKLTGECKILSECRGVPEGDAKDKKNVVMETEHIEEKEEVLFFVERQYTSEKIQISHDEFKIGRKASLCDYSLENNTVSRVHAIFSLRDDKCYIGDNSSLNGIYVNDEPVGKEQMTRLYDGDLIEFGSEKFIFIETRRKRI